MALDKVTEQRLRRLIAFMRTLPAAAEKHFSMRDWVQHKRTDHEHGLKVGQPVTRKYLFSCGTTACALGWGTAMPYFRRLGLAVVPQYSLWDEEPRMTLEFNGYEIGCDDTASSGFLELTAHKSRRLFGPNNKDKTPKQWAKRAEKLINEWSA